MILCINHKSLGTYFLLLVAIHLMVANQHTVQVEAHFKEKKSLKSLITLFFLLKHKPKPKFGLLPIPLPLPLPIVFEIGKKSTMKKSLFSFMDSRIPNQQLPIQMNIDSMTWMGLENDMDMDFNSGMINNMMDDILMMDPWMGGNTMLLNDNPYDGWKENNSGSNSYSNNNIDKKSVPLES